MRSKCTNCKTKDETFNDYCHSDTWDPAQKAFCDFSKGPTVKNTAEATVANFLTVDTEYSPRFDQCGLSSGQRPRLHHA